MHNIDAILLATDLFLTGPEPTDFATQIAQRFGSKIHLFHVVKRHPDLHVADFPLIEHATEELGKLRERLHESGVEVIQSPVEFGIPSQAIVQHAQKLNVDLIVMGCGKHMPTGSSAVGTVVEAVVQRATHPVLAVHANSSLESKRRILCPVDTSETSRRGLMSAIRMAQTFNVELVVLSVVPDVSWLSAAIESGQFNDVLGRHDRKWREDLEDFLRNVDFRGVAWTVEVRDGSPHEKILEAAEDFDAGLIVMGATGQTGLFKGLLGGVTRKVLRQLDRSILIVKSEDLLDEFSEEDARVVELLFAEGQALMECTSYEAARFKFDQVLSHNPFHRPALLRRADALEQIGQKEAAERTRRRAAAVAKMDSAGQ